MAVGAEPAEPAETKGHGGVRSSEVVVRISQILVHAIEIAVTNRSGYPKPAGEVLP